ncbi:hypothetical protein [Pedobacter ginsengiterrae]
MIRPLLSYILLYCVLLAMPILSKAATDPLRGRDLFTEKPNRLVSWLGYIKSNLKEGISNVPMFIIEDTDTYAKIICVPSKPIDWNSKFKGKSSAQKASITKTLAQGIHDRSIGANQFSIFAFVKQVTNTKSNVKSSRSNDITFPSRIFVYVSSGRKWIKITEKVVTNISDYGNLQYQTATATL